MNTINITDLDGKPVKFAKFLPENLELYLGKLRFTILMQVNGDGYEFDGTLAVCENDMYKDYEDGTFVVTSDTDTIGFKVIDSALLSECEFTYNIISKSYTFTNGHTTYTPEYIYTKINTIP